MLFKVPAAVIQKRTDPEIFVFECFICEYYKHEPKRGEGPEVESMLVTIEGIRHSNQTRPMKFTQKQIIVKKDIQWCLFC